MELTVGEGRALLGRSVTNISPLAISGTPAAGVQGTPYVFLPNTSGGVPPYTFSQTGTLPTGTTFDTSTGAISGTPTTPGTFSGINISVTDAALTTASLGPLSITITGSVAPLTISGTPPNGTQGLAYTFTPTVAGGVVPYTFSKTGTFPPGLSLDTGTGVLSGTPTTTGTYTTLRIIVTDAALTTATLGPFTIVIFPGGGGGSGQPIGFLLALTKG